MAGNKQGINVSQYWEEFLLRDGYDTEGTLRAKFLAVTDSIVDNEDGTHTFNFSDGTDYVFTVNDLSSVSYDGGNLIFTFADGSTSEITLKALRDVDPIINNGDGTYTFHFTDGTEFTTEDFQAKDIESGAGVTDGDDVTVTFTRKDTTSFDVLLQDIRGGQGIRGFQGAYRMRVYRVGTIASDYTGDLTSTFDTATSFDQDNGTPTDWLASRAGILADGEIYWVREAVIDPSLVDETGMLTLTWEPPFQEESGAGGATAGVIEYTDGSGGTREVAQWIGTINQYNALSTPTKDSEILFTITNDQTEVAEAAIASEYGDTDVQAYLNANTYVGGITVAASQINLLDGKVDADLTNTQLNETDIANFGFTKDTQITKTQITGLGFVADSTTLAGYGITDAATSTQGGKADTAVQQEDVKLGIGRAAADGNIELQATGTNPQVRIYADDDATGVIQFRNTTTLETALRNNNNTGTFDILANGGSAITITSGGIAFDRPVSGGGVLAVRTYTEYIDLHNDFATLPAHTMIHFTGHLPIFYNNTTVPAPLYFATSAGGNDFFAFYDEADIIPNLANYDSTNGVGSGLSVARTGVTLSDATGTEFRDSEDNIYQINGVGGDANYFRTTSTLVANITDSQTNGGLAIADVPHTGYLYEHATTTAYYMFDGTNLLRLTT